MEGSPVRGHRSRSSALNKVQSIQNFQSEFIRLLAAELRHAEVFFSAVDTTSKVLETPRTVKAHLERHPALFKKLEEGELVGVSPTTDMNAGTHDPRTSIILIPVISDAVLHGVIGVVSGLDDPQPSQEDLETIRGFAHDAAPILARLHELETLRRENRELQAKNERSTATEENLAQIFQEKSALEAVIQMRSHLLSNVAHELRTPLAAVRGYARMILDGKAGAINDTQKDYLQVVAENTNRLIHLVTWMSHVSDLSPQQFKLSSFDLRELWTESIQEYRADLEQRAVKIKEQIPNEPYVTAGDREKLAYVFDQLILAAAKYVNDGGTIIAEFSHGREREVTVKISHFGAALPPETLSSIFEPTWSVTQIPPARSETGRGLSLSGVYDVIGMHGGRLFVTSKAGEGSTFLFTLPAVMYDGGERLANDQAIHSGRRRR